MNNPTLFVFCHEMIGRADIEGSKSDVDLSSWPPQASYPSGNYSGTSRVTLQRILKGSLSPNFFSISNTEGPRQFSFSLYRLRKISVLTELNLGHLR